MKPVILLIFLLCSTIIFGQDDDSAWKEASKESQAFHKYRQHLSYPPYSIRKIDSIIKKSVVSDSEDNLVLKTPAYQSLSLREKFTYVMLHAESYSQNCDAMPPIQDEQKKIFSYLPDAFSEMAWSDRQINFMKENNDSVLALITECSAKNKRIGINFKQAILELNAAGTIPFLIKIYKTDRKDHDILTLLMLLMNENKYAPFLASASWKKLYGEESNYQDFLNYNRANEELIIKRATEFFNGLKK